MTLYDEYGDINFYMIPFVKPFHVRKIFPDEAIASYTDAMKTVIKNMNINLYIPSYHVWEQAEFLLYQGLPSIRFL